MRWLLVAASLAWATTAHADSSSVMVTLTPEGQDLATAFGDSEAALIQKAQDKIQSYYQTARVPQVLDALLATTALVNRDVGVDYVLDPGEWTVGVLAGGAVSTDITIGSSTQVIAGAIPSFGLTGGGNLARWGLPKWSVFANGFYEAYSIRGLDGHLTTLGGHVQYRAVDPRGVWLGVLATTGVEVSHWTLGNSAPIVTHFTLDGSTPGTSRNLTLTSVGTLSLVATTAVIPLEVVTGIRPLSWVALYAGGGADLAVGSSTITAQLAGDLTVTQDGTKVGSVVITASGDRSPPALDVHALAGIQFMPPHVHIALQGLVAPSDYGASFALRAVW